MLLWLLWSLSPFARSLRSFRGRGASWKLQLAIKTHRFSISSTSPWTFALPKTERTLTKNRTTYGNWRTRRSLNRKKKEGFIISKQVRPFVRCQIFKCVFREGKRSNQIIEDEPRSKIDSIKTTSMQRQWYRLVIHCLLCLIWPVMGQYNATNTTNSTAANHVRSQQNLILCNGVPSCTLSILS